MFMSAGLIYAALGHDRIAGLAGVGRRLPMSVLAFALAGVALIGVPPSGAYLAKELLLQAASETGQWWWAVAIQAGGILTSSYVVLVLAHAMAPADQPVAPRVRIARMGEAAALALALCSLLLGLVPWQGYLPVPPGVASTPTVCRHFRRPCGRFSPASRWRSCSGAGMTGSPASPWAKPSPATVSAVRCAALFFGSGIERIDGVLRQWPAAGLCMLVLAIAFAAAMLAAR
jgi:NADH:ubiquinone oxidoreductase subunit 5 (subunit L)/multisubunit Na+/H+ antiporter MnhA subunit